MKKVILIHGALIGTLMSIKFFPLFGVVFLMSSTTMFIGSMVFSMLPGQSDVQRDMMAKALLVGVFGLCLWALSMGSLFLKAYVDSFS